VDDSGYLVDLVAVLVDYYIVMMGFETDRCQGRFLDQK
jgi:hypothetical protein